MREEKSGVDAIGELQEEYRREWEVGVRPLQEVQRTTVPFRSRRKRSTTDLPPTSA